jgi:glucose-6-phosphate isomerase
MDLWASLRSKSNLAIRFTLTWYHATKTRPERDMVVTRYNDRLRDFPKYLQSLIMEFLGREKSINPEIAKS